MILSEECLPKKKDIKSHHLAIDPKGFILTRDQIRKQNENIRALIKKEINHLFCCVGIYTQLKLMSL